MTHRSSLHAQETRTWKKAEQEKIARYKQAIREQRQAAWVPVNAILVGIALIVALVAGLILRDYLLSRQAKLLVREVQEMDLEVMMNRGKPLAAL